MLDWYTQNIPYLLREFKTDLERGLSREEATTHYQKYGSNEIRQPRETSLLTIFLKQLSSLTAILLFVICILLYLQHAIREGLVLVSIFCFHVLWRFIQAAKTRHQLQSIQQHLDVSVSVIRDTGVIKLPPMALVPGDLLVLTAGDYIAADARLIDADALLVDETPLFGTTTFAQKTDEDISDPGLPPEKQRNMVFAGTYVLEGEARAIVVGTGQQLEINQPNRRVPVLLDLEPEAETQMGILYDYFRIAGGILGSVVVIVALLFQGKTIEENWIELLFLGFGFAIAAIPEGVASTSRAILAEHAYKLLGKGVAIRNLINLERLGGITAICIDEVGNFTREDLVASHVFVDERLVDRETWEAWLKSLEERAPDEIDEDTLPTTLLDSHVPPEFPLLILLANRCTEGSRGGRMDANSASAEANITAVLKQIAERIGFDLERYNSAFTKVSEQPQTPEHPYRTLVFSIPQGKFLQLIFGDAEAVLEACYRVQLHGTIDYMSFDHKELMRQAIYYLSNNKTRVFALAYRNLNAPVARSEMRRNMTFLGLIAFTQLEYSDSDQTIQACLDSGIKIVMITDKDRQTASDMAKELGIIQDKNAVVAKEDLDEFSDADYESMVDRLLVYCRPAPEQKLNIVQYLKRRGHSVGFGGKSSRDLRAMRVADVSFASVSRSAHVVQQHAACLVLKSGFHVIADLLLHVRESYINLRGSMRWLLSCSLAQIITLIVGFVLPYLGLVFPLLRELPMPLSLLQLIWVHLLVNLIPLMSLGHDHIRGEMRYSRPQKSHPFLSKADFSDVLLRGLVIASMTIFSFVLTYVGRLQGFSPVTEAVKQSAQTAAQTAAATTLIFTQLVSSFQCHRHSWESTFQRIKANLPLLFTILACMALHLSVVYIPSAQQIFGFTTLFKAWQWILPFSVMLIFLPLNLVRHRR